MFKWLKITENQYFGIFLLGIVLFILQELPYMIMPFIKMESNVLMEMEDKLAWLNISEKILGVFCIAVMIFLVKGDAKWFSLLNKREVVAFSFAMIALFTYYVGWVFYFKGFQSLTLILTMLVAMPPLYYACIGVWRGNYVLTILGFLFLCIHLTNVWVNLGSTN